MGNEESRAWHEKFGFVEEPDLMSAQLYYRHTVHELRRHECRAEFDRSADGQSHPPLSPLRLNLPITVPKSPFTAC